MQGNPIGWFEIYTADLQRARRFYETVFQTTLQPLAAPPGDAGGFEMLAFPSNMERYGCSGTLVRMEGVPPGGGGTLVYFSCDDCAEEESRVVAAGGAIHKAKFSIGPYGFCSLVVDTEKNMIGLHSMK